MATMNDGPKWAHLPFFDVFQFCLGCDSHVLKLSRHIEPQGMAKMRLMAQIKTVNSSDVSSSFALFVPKTGRKSVIRKNAIFLTNVYFVKHFAKHFAQIRHLLQSSDDRSALPFLIRFILQSPTCKEYRHLTDCKPGGSHEYGAGRQIHTRSVRTKTTPVTAAAEGT